MRSVRILVGLAVFWLSASFPVPVGWAQSKEQVLASTDRTSVTSVRVVEERNGPVVAVMSDRPLVPAISKLETPLRVVIDLPNARLSTNKKHIAFHNSEILGVRINQFQKTVARIVVDLARPVTYTWDAEGNRLIVRLHAAEDVTEAASVPALKGNQSAAVAPNSASSGTLVLAGNRVGAGSSITAGSDTAVLRLGRGGEVRVCPGTTVSVTPSQNGRSLMLGMSTGGLEAHYTLDASSDSILTPDFRILLAGPGEFHYGISADQRGNTCVQALPGNTASVIVSELLGDGTYQVKPAQQVLFHFGQLKMTDSTVPASCGCPAPAPPIMRTSAQPAIPGPKSPSSMDLARAVDYEQPATAPEPAALQGPPSLPGPETATAALPASRPSDVHVQVDVPFVFRANDYSDPPSARPSPTSEAELLPIRDLPRPELVEIAALPPSRARTLHHSFFGKLKSFFSAIFG
jgi:hypothetical protein